MKNLIKTVWNHVCFWSENYIIIPLYLLAIVSSACLFKLATGYSSTEDIGAIVGWLTQSLGVVLVMSLTGFCQYLLYGYRNKDNKGPLSGDIHDSCVTSFLLVLFSVLVFGLLK
jgi:hypothetical protein